MPDYRADYARARLSTLLGFQGSECNNAAKRGLSIVSEIKLGDPKDAKTTIAEWTRDDLEATVLVLAAMVDDSKTIPELLNPIVELMANPAIRCGQCGKWFHGQPRARFCSRTCRARNKKEQA